MSRGGFTDDEMAQIVGRAAALQDDGEAPSAAHTLADVQEVAAQVGIPPELVARAAADLPRRPAPSALSQVLFGPSASRVAIGVLDGPVPASSYAGILAAARGATGQIGRASEIGHSLEWRTGSLFYEMNLTVVPGEQQTTVRVEGNYDGWRRLPYLVAIVASAAVGLAMTPTQNLTAVTLTTMGALASGWAAADILWGVLSRKVESRVTFLRDAVMKYWRADPAAFLPETIHTNGSGADGAHTNGAPDDGSVN